ncbi:MAG: hypothetical protein CL910_08575 [Deltaproteobacteria bacterium]|jgi:hypothetical protein|nr:hypothetical protein [Deltaproteobacteria bacterium]
MSSTPSRRDPFPRWRDLAGLLALATMLALGSPGVQVARAEEAPSATVTRTPLSNPALQSIDEESGPQSCEPAPRNLPSASQLGPALQALQAKVEAEGGDVVVFNGAGHNYRSSRGPLSELGEIRAELEREQAR